MNGTDPVKIYLAARYTGGRVDPRSNNPNQLAAASEPYPFHLESFHYIGKGQHDDVIRHTGNQIFMDSGAFSMFTQGVKVDLDKYARFLTTRRDYIEVASNLDVIGRSAEQKSYDNQKYFESLKLPVQVCPVHHARDDDSWLVKYLDEGYDYIFLGGMVPESTPYLIDWLDHIWDKYLALPDGTARVKIHGFGLTTFELMERYPWYSVDSTSWVQKGMFGLILIDINGKPMTLPVSKVGHGSKDAGKSLWSMDSYTQAQLMAQIRERGFDPEELATMYGMRDKWNIRYYREYMANLKPLFVRKQVTFFT